MNLRVMKTAILVFIISLSCITMLNAQDSLTRKRANPHFWFKLYDDVPRKPLLRVKLYEVKDSSLVISKTSRIADYSTGNFEATEVYINDIKAIRYRNTHNTIIGVLIGTASGLLVGAIIGSTEVDSPSGSWFYSSAGTKAKEDMIGCALMGGCAGAVLSQIKIKIPLYGNSINYSKYKNKLEKKSVRYKYLSGR